MEPITAVGVIIGGILAFIGWLIRDRFKKLEEIDTRLTKVETKFDVLGDISATLHTLRTDIEIIKSKLNKP